MDSRTETVEPATSASKVALACECGRFEARLDGLRPAVANRVVCCCRSCQDYARSLGRERNLDAYGGTEVFQVSPKRLVVERGLEVLACVRQTPKGPLRWYTACCHTPLANTFPKPGVFMAVMAKSLHVAGVQLSQTGLAPLLGPVRATVNGRIPKAERFALRATRWALFTMISRLGTKMLMWRLRGQQRSNPFFNDEGKPHVRWTSKPTPTSEPSP